MNGNGPKSSGQSDCIGVRRMLPVRQFHELIRYIDNPYSMGVSTVFYGDIIEGSKSGEFRIEGMTKARGEDIIIDQ